MRGAQLECPTFVEYAKLETLKSAKFAQPCSSETHACAHANTHIHMHAHIHIHTYRHMHRHRHRHKRRQTHMHTHTHACTHVACVRPCVHTCVSTHATDPTISLRDATAADCCDARCAAALSLGFGLACANPHSSTFPASCNVIQEPLPELQVKAPRAPEAAGAAGAAARLCSSN